MQNLKTILLVLLSVAVLGAAAQRKTDGETFDLTKQGAHYVFTASINGTADATILVESCIPAILFDSAYVFSSGVLSGMNLSPAGQKEKINLGGRVYKITHKANGKVLIGNSTSYIGDVFVLSNYDYGKYEAAVPVMYLHNDLDKGRRIVQLDLADRRLQMLSRASLRKIKSSYIKNDLNSDIHQGMPAIMTSLTIDDGYDSRTLSGNFFIDFGNPELLFLIQQTEAVQRFLSSNEDLKLHDAMAPNGQVVGQYIVAEECQLCGLTFNDAVIVITQNLPRFTLPGNIGLKFFENIDAVFDFDHSAVYFK